MEKVVNEIIVEVFLKNPIILIVIILIIPCYFYGNRIVGKAGEFWVKKELKKLNKNIYKVINNITIVVNNITHQIDHIVVSKYGIFVIETKQYSGYIKGNDYDKSWIQNNKVYINNPIHQNYGHIKTLEEVLKIQENNFIPIICIPSEAKLKIRTKNHVIKLYDLNKTITSYTKEILPNYNELYDKIVSLKNTDRTIIKEHNNMVQNIKKENENKCPLCGGVLTKRNGKYGEFIGCSNYPKCKYTKKI